MEGACRLFAGEFSRSTLSVPGEDDRSAAWVVTPSGCFCRQVFLAGALVEVREQGDMILARLADPTGGFDLVCGGNPASLKESLRMIPLPSFISVSGRAQVYRREGKPVLSIRPEQVHVIDRRTRDQWVVGTAASTLERLEKMHRALQGTCSDAGILQACTHYHLTATDLDELAEMAAGALANVRRLPEPAPDVVADPREAIMELIRTGSGPRGISVEEIIRMAGLRAVSPEAALAAIESLIVEDECYQPQKGYVKPL